VTFLPELTMTLMRFACLAAPLACAFVADVAVATDWGRAGVTPSNAPASTLSPRSTSATPLKGEMRVSPGGLQLSGVKTNIEALSKDFGKFAGNAKAYEFMAGGIPEMVKQCSSKAYSVQDQAAAGCTANDTVAQCSSKLLKHCLANYKGNAISTDFGLPGRTNTGSVKVGFSIQEFQQSAAAAAAGARALSQSLNLYATQVENSAKALVP
jgi:hypothetical protein